MLRLFLCIIFTLSIGKLFASSPTIKISEIRSDKYIGNHLKIYQDVTHNLGIEDIRENDDLFKLSFNGVPNFGVSNHNNWIKFQFINDSPLNNLILNISNPTIDYITLYTEVNGKLDSVKIDKHAPLSARPLDHQFYTFNLNVHQQDTITCYLKLKSAKQLLVPIIIASENTIAKVMFDYDLSAGIFIGIMLMVLLYNLFIYISVRDNHYLTFVHYIFWVAVAQIAILGFFLRFFNPYTISNFYIVTFAGAMSGIASVIFVKSFLNTQDYGKRLNRYLNAIITGDLIAICFLLFGNPVLSYQIVNLVAGLGSVTVLIIGVIALKKGNKSAKLFLIAWGMFLGSVIVYVLKDYGILPYETFTFHSVQIGVSIEALLLSFALANKINIYRKEKEESQSKALKVLLENEQLIREQNLELERNVEERTRELTESNESLQTTLTHLKETQSQLVEAEKMASLGQLTAGVAHEINNPINFVTSNVAPLRRDINMLWDAMDTFEKMALSNDISAQEKSKLISDYKDELDLEYIKVEVEFLLKGMHEGASRTAEIVKSLRVFSRVDENTLKFADINEGVESTMVILNTLVKDRIDVVKLYGDIPSVECYAGKLNQVFLNIISNAIYAIDKKIPVNSGGVLKIETGLMDEGASVFIKITDNGIGIPEDIKHKIFEPFFTTKDVGEGTGLGMSIAYTTIDKHKGKIIIDTEIGKGTTFNVIIPIKQSL